MKNEEFDLRFAEALEQSLPPFSPQVKARAVEGMAAAAGRASRKVTRPMRLAACVIAFLLVIGLAAAGLLTYSRSPDAKALLISAAEAMETARSVRIVGHGCEGDPSSPSGMRMSPEPLDMSWRYNTSERGVEWCMRRSGRMGHAYRIDLDRKEWRFYDGRAGICYRADITEVISQAEIQVRAMREKATKRLPMQAVQELDYLSDRRQSAETETRDGREIAIVTVTGMNSLTPAPLAERHVFEVDMATNHLLRSERYVRAEGSEEQLLETIDLVEYDVPVPGPPEEAEVVTATAAVEDMGTYRSLRMYAPDGEEIVRSDQPK